MSENDPTRRSARISPAPARMNREWHRLHPMSPKATREQRIKWHAAHATACACRSVPKSLEQDVEKLLRLGGSPTQGVVAVSPPKKSRLSKEPQ